MPVVENEYDGNAARVSLYGKGTVAGDTALPISTAAFTAIPGSLSVALAAVNGTTVNPVATGSVVSDANSAVNMLPVVTSVFNGAAWDRLRTPAIFKHAIATAAGNTAVWTPAAGKKFRLMRFAVGISGGTLLAVAGIETITFQDSASGLNGVRFDVQVPSTVVTGEEYFSGWIDWGNGFLSAVANNVLNVNLGTATTAGGVTVMVAGTEE